MPREQILGYASCISTVSGWMMELQSQLGFIKLLFISSSLMQRGLTRSWLQYSNNCAAKQHSLSYRISRCCCHDDYWIHGYAVVVSLDITFGATDTGGVREASRPE